MNATQLQKPNGEGVNIWYCGVCGRTSTYSNAENCCTPVICDECGEPTGSLHNGWGVQYTHPECWRKQSDRRYREGLETAEVVEEWDGPVYTEEFHGGRDGYFNSLSDLIDEVMDAEESGFPDGGVKPEKVLVCNSRPFRCMDAYHVAEDATEDMHEDAYDEVNGQSLVDLQAALDKFEAANAWIVTYEPDPTRVVRVVYPER